MEFRLVKSMTSAEFVVEQAILASIIVHFQSAVHARAFHGALGVLQMQHVIP